MNLKHHQRPVRFVELWETQGWKIKIYTIIEPGVDVAFDSVQIAKDLAAPQIARANGNDAHHSSAFMIIHLARMFHQILFDYWARSNELRQRVFKAEPQQPSVFNDITATGEAFCVWELGIIAFEREAWMKHVLLPERPSQRAYHAAHLEGLL